MKFARPDFWGAIIAACLLPLAAQGQSWPEAAYNPAPSADDLVLPMPCGGAMTFRPVDVPGGDVFDDRKIQLGTRDPARAFVENPRAEFLSGSFRVDGAWRYYLGKYEATVAQFEALAGGLAGDCPDAEALESRLPKVEVTVAEAMMAAESLSEWLLSEARDSLPQEGETPGYLRLPTEAEWEFAARGGAQVEPLAFEARMPPMEVPPTRFIWFDGVDSANRELQLVGLLQPNPLGLHDMLGNAAELVSGLFRLNHVGREHGRAGAYVKRGGDYRTKLDRIHSGLREEFAPLGRRGLRREKTTGFRLALVAPALPDRERLQAAQEGWSALSQTDRVELAEAQEDPRAEVSTLADFIAALNFGEKAEVERRLRNLGDIIDVNIATRNDERGRAARAMLRVAVFAGLRLPKHLIGQDNCSELLEINPERYRDRCARMERDFEFDLSFYLNHVSRIGAEYPKRVLDEQGMILLGEFESRNFSQLARHLDRVQTDVVRVRAEGAVAREAVVDGWRDARN